jgi:hypothetical protein
VGADTLADIADGLYQLPPEQFIAARDEAVKRARAAGDRRLAAEVGKLRRPTVGAWVVNRLVRHRPELIGELFLIGDQMRLAQRDLHGDMLRELSLRRRFVVDALSKAAVVLARRDHRRDNLPIAEIEATLMAALADPEVAQQVRAGQLTKTVEYTGFGETPRPRLRLVQGGIATDPPPSTTDDRRSNAIPRTPMGLDRPTPMGDRADVETDERADAERREAEQAETERREAERAEAERVEAERREAERVAAAQRREAERAAAAQLKRVRAAAHRELLAARAELADAEAARVLAERAVTAARRRVEKAATALNNLESDDGEIDEP